MGRGASKRPTKAEYEQRVSEITELLLTRVSKRAIVRFAAERWDVRERATEKYMADARTRIRELASYDLRNELGKAIGAYELIFTKLVAKGDLRGARATLDQMVALLGLAAAERTRSGEQHAEVDSWLNHLTEEEP